MRLAICLLAVVASARSVNGAVECKDTSPDCPQWRRNMARSQGMRDGPMACRGNDFGFMKNNCPVTCELCAELGLTLVDDAAKAKEAKMTKSRFVEGVSPACEHVRGSAWQWRGQAWNGIVTLLEDGAFESADEACREGRCKWSCREIGDECEFRGDCTQDYYAAALISLYEAHKPEKVGEVGALLAKYKKREASVLALVRQKYARPAAEEDAEAAGAGTGAVSDMLVLQIDWDGALYNTRLRSRGHFEGTRPFLNEDVSGNVELWDPYRALGVKADESSSKIRRVYRRLSIALHPDKLDAGALGADGMKLAQERFDAVADAYTILSDVDTRAIYDAYGSRQFTTSDDYVRAVERGQIKHLTSFFAAGDEPAVSTITGQGMAALQEFDKAVLAADAPPTVVFFYQQWCKTCVSAVQPFKKAAMLLEADGVKAYSVSCHDASRLCMELQVGDVNMSPVIRYWAGSKPAPFGFEQFRPEASRGPERKWEVSSDEISGWVKRLRDYRVVELTAATFESEVLKAGPQAVWLVDFSAGPWCGPCQHLKSALADAAIEASEAFQVSSGGEDEEEGEPERMQVHVGIINCDEEKALCEKQQLGYYPQLRLFSAATAGGSVDEPSGEELKSGNAGKAILESFGSVMKHFAAAAAAGAGDAEGGAAGSCTAAAADQELQELRERVATLEAALEDAQA